MRTITFKTLAEFKRLATRGKFIRGGYYGKYADEWREIAGVQSNAIRLKTEGRGIVYFEWPKARDCEILQEADGSVLKIYEERAKIGGNDMRADSSCIAWDLESGAIKESDIIRYKKQVAEYRLGEQ